MRKEKKGHELEREIKTEKERNKAMHGQTHTQCYGLICQQVQELVEPVLPLQLKFSISTENKGHDCKYVSVIGLIFIGVAF